MTILDSSTSQDNPQDEPPRKTRYKVVYLYPAPLYNTPKYLYPALSHECEVVSQCSVLMLQREVRAAIAEILGHSFFKVHTIEKIEDGANNG